MTGMDEAGVDLSLVDEFERRISFALQRIDRGVTALQARAAAPARSEGPENPIWAEFAARDRAELNRLRAVLETEQAEKAQLSERVQLLSETQETTLAAMEARLVEATGALEAAQAEVTRLKQANADLSDANRALLEAGGDLAPHLVNAALQAEVEGLRAERALQLAELDEILAGLDPLIERHAQPGVSDA
jgi:chromosome segregation ATPase